MTAEPAQAVVDRISAAVWAVAADCGLENVSMRAIAARADCTTGLITHHFGSRAEVLIHACRTMYSRVAARADAIEAGREPSIDMLVDVLAVVLPLDHDRIDEVRVWAGFAATALAEPQLQEIHVDHHRRWVSRITRLVDDLSPTGSVVDGGDIAKSLSANVNGLALTAILDSETYPAHTQLRLLTRCATVMLGSLTTTA
ncbi:UNVERIFIED_CONTAM: TetR family transcriptional regulator [Williamsia faeni]